MATSSPGLRKGEKVRLDGRSGTFLRFTSFPLDPSPLLFRGFGHSPCLSTVYCRSFIISEFVIFLPSLLKLSEVLFSPPLLPLSESVDSIFEDCRNNYTLPKRKFFQKGAHPGSKPWHDKPTDQSSPKAEVGPGLPKFFIFIDT